MERRNITNEFLKECIADALIQLLRVKPLEDITITEITDVAGVGRSTYYRNFTSKEDVLSYKLFILGYRWLVKEKLSSDMESEELLKSYCCFIYEIRDLLNLLYQNSQTNVLIYSIYKYLGPKEGEDKGSALRKSGLIFGGFGILYEWLKRGMEETPEELAQLLITGWEELRN
ncbi:MAG: TetR/AcrR family transcriptional regulator [Erysipelotrichales bacterium]|nr:TetR/AcrR family transcriptional regulator [Erysipelotrichales bacterium]